MEEGAPFAWSHDKSGSANTRWLSKLEQSKEVLAESGPPGRTALIEQTARVCRSLGSRLSAFLLGRNADGSVQPREISAEGYA